MLSHIASFTITDQASDYVGVEFSFVMKNSALHISLNHDFHYSTQRLKTTKEDTDKKNDHVHKFLPQKISNFKKALELHKLEAQYDKKNNDFTILNSQLTNIILFLIQNKIITTRDQLNNLGNNFKLSKTEIYELSIDLYIRTREEKPEHTSIFKWLFSCCFFSSTSRTAKLEAAKKLKESLKVKNVTFSDQDKEALAHRAIALEYLIDF